MNLVKKLFGGSKKEDWEIFLDKYEKNHGDKNKTIKDCGITHKDFNLWYHTNKKFGMRCNEIETMRNNTIEDEIIIEEQPIEPEIETPEEPTESETQPEEEESVFANLITGAAVFTGAAEDYDSPIKVAVILAAIYLLLRKRLRLFRKILRAVLFRIPRVKAIRQRIKNTMGGSKKSLEDYGFRIKGKYGKFKLMWK